MDEAHRQGGLDYDAALEKALCFGWIDSKRAADPSEHIDRVAITV